MNWVRREIGPFAVVRFQVWVGQTAQVTRQVGAQDKAQVRTKQKSYGSAAGKDLG